MYAHIGFYMYSHIDGIPRHIDTQAQRTMDWGSVKNIQEMQLKKQGR